MSENKRGRKKTKDRISTSIFLDRDLHEWTVGKNRSDLINQALRFMKNTPVKVVWNHDPSAILSTCENIFNE